MELTVKQQKFCDLYLELGNASEAYRRTYDCSKMKPDTVNRAATALLDNYKIATRVKELQAEMREKSGIKREELLSVLTRVIRGEDIIDFRRGNGDMATVQTIAKTWAIERICRMLGFDAPTQTEVTASLSAGGRKPVAEMTEEERKAEIRRIYESLNRC